MEDEIKNELSYLKKNADTVERVYDFNNINSFEYVKENGGKPLQNILEIKQV